MVLQNCNTVAQVSLCLEYNNVANVQHTGVAKLSHCCGSVTVAGLQRCCKIVTSVCEGENDNHLQVTYWNCSKLLI